jgi:protease YdgD
MLRNALQGEEWMKLVFSMLCGTAALLLGPAFSKELQPGIIGADNRQIVESDGPPWENIGHVNVEGYRTALRCTGILVRPNVVLTAAHCLIDPWKGSAVSVDRVHFVRNVRGAQFEDHSRAKCLRFLPGHLDFSTRSGIKRRQQLSFPFLARDIVAIVLADALEAAALELAAESQVRPGSIFVHASYPADRRYLLSADFQCRLVQPLGQIWLSDCDTHAASSGGPVFARMLDGTLKLAGIMVGVIEHRSTIVVPSLVWSGLAQNGNCP